MNAHYDEGMIDIFAPNIEGFSFQPTMHVHYQERLVDFPMNYQSLRTYRKTLVVPTNLWKTDKFQPQGRWRARPIPSIRH